MATSEPPAKRTRSHSTTDSTPVDPPAAPPAAVEPAAGAPKDSTKLEKNSKAREKEAASKIGRTHYMKELKAQMAVMKRARSDLDYLPEEQEELKEIMRRWLSDLYIVGIEWRCSTELVASCLLDIEKVIDQAVTACEKEAIKFCDLGCDDENYIKNSEGEVVYHDGLYTDRVRIYYPLTTLLRRDLMLAELCKPKPDDQLVADLHAKITFHNIDESTVMPDWYPEDFRAAHPRLVELLKTNPVSAPKCKNWGMARAKRAKMLARRQLA